MASAAALPRSVRFTAIFRAGLLLLCLVLVGVQAAPVAVYGWMLSLVGLAVLASFLAAGDSPGTATVRLAETAVCAGGVIATGGARSPLLPYLLAPAFAGGLSGGIQQALFPPGLAAIILVVGTVAPLHHQTLRDYSAAASEWVLLSAAVGLIASWIRLLLPKQNDPQDSYFAAYRLLSQLRTVSRQLSSGLDPVTLADHILRSAADEADVSRAVLLVRAKGERLMPLGHFGAERVDWDTDLAGENPFAEAWLTQQPQRRPTMHTRGPEMGSGSSLVIPLRIGLRSFGLLGVESRNPDAYPADVVQTLSSMVSESALRLETALIFDEIRELATVEERRRVAREIHDGIAQELASVGYIVDGLVADSARGDGELVAPLRQLRSEVTRIVSELRLSIFDLRSDIDQYGGFGAALSDYVRTVGASSPFTVHLSLDERPTRLPAEVEAELLRIAQEAITNARKHAKASNLWVDVVVDPPRARLRVEDDGAGLGAARLDSFGLEIMRERAHRLRASLDIRPRDPQGTTVEVVLDRSPRAATVSPQMHSSSVPRR